jgi:hypothetical protein
MAPTVTIVDMRHSLTFVLLFAAGCGSSEPNTPKPERTGKVDYFPSRLDGPATGCSPTTCMGCCSGTTCVSSPSVASCGYGGNPCQVCKGTQDCVDGSCSDQKKCDATTCKTGCCDDKGACQPGSTDAICGTAGGACAPCDTGAGEVCLAGKCGQKGTGSYSISLVGCHIDNSWWTGPCSMESSCDPYVILTVGATSKESSHKSDTNDPVWNEPLLNAAAADITKTFDIEVYDENYGPDTKIGVCSWKVTDADLTAGKIVQHCGSPMGETYVKDLTFTFKPI